MNISVVQVNRASMSKQPATLWNNLRVLTAHWPGSVQDSSLEKQWEIISQFDGSACLLGDSDYDILSPRLTTPFKPLRTHRERQYLYNILDCRELS